MTRRGVGLLLVLLVLVVATTVAAGAAHLAIASRAHAFVADRSRVADALRVGAEGHIDHFLRIQSTRVALAADAASPSLPVLDDQLLLNGTSYRVRITAFDQCGMLPWTQSGSGSPLRAALPPRVARLCDTLPGHRTAPGLDMFVGPARDAGLTAFPPSARPAPRDHPRTSIALGSMLATHNPEPASRASSLADGGLINVNTAPRALLVAALRAGGAGGLDEILSSRAAGRPAAAPPTRAPTTPIGGLPPPHSPVRLVAQSDCWAFRVDIETTSVGRSWWLVYRASGSQWRCVQRVAINE